MCQCPSSGLLHFYVYNLIGSTDLEVCQCPSSGLLHFYEQFTLTEKQVIGMCQCPSSGLLHFYYTTSIAKTKTFGCQCPSSGLLHFYKVGSKSVSIIWGVSMPFIRLTPFLRYPLEPLCLCGFPDLFLQVIHRIF